MSGRKGFIQQRGKKGEYRARVTPAFEDAVWAEIEAESRRFKVSYSFVINLALAEHLGIDVESYRKRFDRRTLGWKRPLALVKKRA